MKERELELRAKAFAARVIRLCVAPPERATERAQPMRSGTPMGAHYREAQRAKSNADFTSKIEGAQQELDESRYWIELTVEPGIFPPAKLAALHTECDELLAIFATVSKTAKRH
jgi:four helix bundle protein